MKNREKIKVLTVLRRRVKDQPKNYFYGMCGIIDGLRCDDIIRDEESDYLKETLEEELVRNDFNGYSWRGKSVATSQDDASALGLGLYYWRIKAKSPRIKFLTTKINELKKEIS